MKQTSKRKIGIIVALALGCILSSPLKASAATTLQDIPTIKELREYTRQLEAAQEEKKRQEEAERIALATNMISEVVVTYTVNTYPVGQCTWGAKEMAPWIGNYWGNAGDWADSAVLAGFEVGTTPKVGAVIVWKNSGYGHVAYVTDVGENGLIQVVESNYAGSMVINNYRGFFNPTLTGEGEVYYIYPPQTP